MEDANSFPRRGVSCGDPFRNTLPNILPKRWRVLTDIFFDRTRSRALTTSSLVFLGVYTFYSSYDAQAMKRFGSIMLGAVLVCGVNSLGNINRSFLTFPFSLAWIGLLNFWILYSNLYSKVIKSVDEVDILDLSEIFIIVVLAILMIIIDICALNTIVPIPGLSYNSYSSRMRHYSSHVKSRMRKLRKHASRDAFRGKSKVEDDDDDEVITHGSSLCRGLWCYCLSCWCCCCSFVQSIKGVVYIPSLLFVSSFTTAIILAFCAVSSLDWITATGRAIYTSTIAVQDGLDLLDRFDDTAEHLFDTYDPGQLANAISVLKAAALNDTYEGNLTEAVEVIELHEELLQNLTLTLVSFDFNTNNASYEDGVDLEHSILGRSLLSENTTDLDYITYEEMQTWFTQEYRPFISGVRSLMIGVVEVILSIVSNLFVPSIVSVNVAFWVGTISTLSVMRMYRETQRDLRKGSFSRRISGDNQARKEFNGMFSITHASTLLGIQFASGYVGFYVVSSLVFSIVFFLTWDQSWERFHGLEVLSGLAQVILIWVFKTLVFDLLWGRRLITKDRTTVLKSPNWAYYFFFSSFLGFLSGILNAIVRFLLLFFLSLGAIFRIDRSLFPESIRWMDSSYVSYMSYALAIHRHDNPYQLVAADAIVSNTHGTEESRRKRRNAFKWKLAYTLLIHPELRQFRKSKLTALPSNVLTEVKTMEAGDVIVDE